jgi:hypothetical protein
VVFVLIGLAGIYLGKDLPMGTASRMGPAYFPVYLSYLIVVIGLIVGAKGLTIDGPRLETIRLRPLIFILAALLGFGVMIDRIGLALSAAIMTLIAAYARPNAKFVESLVLGVGLAIFSVLAFVYALGQALPPWWGR